MRRLDPSTGILFGLGHNGGPPLDEERAPLLVRYAWSRAHREAWKNPSMSVLKFRVARAEAAGICYREYMLALLDTGRHLQKEDIDTSEPESG